jgi:tRNA (adenine37-N6)-methyltransferase
MKKVELQPIGVIRSKYQNKFDAPSQPEHSEEGGGMIELHQDHRFQIALSDLEGFSHIWLLWLFHKNTGWRPKVRPPRGPARKRGLFATRSPHRPNPLGITAVSLRSVKGLFLEIGPHDLLDGTPILDIKPYIPSIDSFSNAEIGWLREVEDFSQQAPRFAVEYSRVSMDQLEWLKRRGVDFMPRALKILTLDPMPHKTRRIVSYSPGVFRMACGGWRLFYSVENSRIVINRIESGYQQETLLEFGTRVPNAETLLEFIQRWK